MIQIHFFACIVEVIPCFTNKPYKVQVQSHMEAFQSQESVHFAPFDARLKLQTNGKHSEFLITSNH